MVKSANKYGIGWMEKFAQRAQRTAEHAEIFSMRDIPLCVSAYTQRTLREKISHRIQEH
jgi:hypothetical protein